MLADQCERLANHVGGNGAADPPNLA
jgi:hypothetical protein